MKLSPDLWHQALMLDREFKKRNEVLSRKKISDALRQNDNTAKLIFYALENRDVINLKLSTVQAHEESELVIADLHIPYIDSLCTELALKDAEENKVNRITILGDLLDFYKISRFVKIPGKKSVKQEIEEAEQFLLNLRLRFPNAKIIYYIGNHELRLEKYICENASEIYDLISDLLPQKLKLHEKNIEYRVKPFKIGNLWHMHGHEKPRGGNPRYVCQVFWKYIHDHFIVAHHHKKQQDTFTHIDGETKFQGNAVGTLANIKQLEYAILNDWNNGYAIVKYDSHGNYRIQNKIICQGEVFT